MEANREDEGWHALFVAAPREVWRKHEAGHRSERVPFAQRCAAADAAWLAVHDPEFGKVAEPVKPQAPVTEAERITPKPAPLKVKPKTRRRT